MIRLPVHAHPGAQRERVEWLAEAGLGVWVRARPVEGQANAAIERALAHHLDLRPRQVRLVAGAAGRRKIVEIDLPTAQEVQARLLAHGMRPR